MAFKVHKAREEHFDNINATIDFAGKEQERICRLQLLGFFDKGARFTHDEELGVSGNSFVFNEYGFDAVCRLVGTNPYFLKLIHEEGLASRILNDVVLSENTTKPLDSLELICDQESRQVLGIVSHRYVGYSNKQFIDDVLSCLKPGSQKSLFPNTGDFDFLEAYSVNTRLFMRIKSKHVVGKVAGRGGESDDVSEIGVEFSNSMSGGHAVRLAYYIRRLICANGLIAKVAGDGGRLVHSGHEQRFRKRLHDKASGVLAGIDKARKMIETLCGIAYDSNKLARLVEIKDVLAMIPDQKKRERCKATFKDRYYPDLGDSKERALQRKADQFDQILDFFGNSESLSVFGSDWRDSASMYDFINVFTEYAKSLNAAQRLQAEEKAGEVADWMAKNKRKFHKLQ